LPPKKKKRDKKDAINLRSMLDDFDTRRSNVIPQLDYIGSQYTDDFFNKKIK